MDNMKNSKRKGFLGRLIERLDKKIEAMAKAKSCCDDKEKSKGKSCCSG